MDNTKTYAEVLKWASSFLRENKKEEVIGEYLILKYNKWNKTDLLLSLRKTAPSELVNRLSKDLEKVIENYPPQYIIGSCDFYGREFLVTEDTLIPRPETEELVYACLSDNTKKALKIIDIGTGTGAIGLTLKLERPKWDVSVVDISDKALDVTRKNGLKLDAEVSYYLGDVLEPIDGDVFDIIISNPPYIAEDEWQEMDESVLLYEPKTALFAEQNGLAIYKKIAIEAKKHLSTTGKIYLEIGYLQGDAVSEIFKTAFPEKQIEVLKDLSGNDRIVKVY